MYTNKNNVQFSFIMVYWISTGELDISGVVPLDWSDSDDDSAPRIVENEDEKDVSLTPAPSDLHVSF